MSNDEMRIALTYPSVVISSLFSNVVALRIWTLGIGILWSLDVGIGVCRNCLRLFLRFC